MPLDGAPELALSSKVMLALLANDEGARRPDVRHHDEVGAGGADEQHVDVVHGRVRQPEQVQVDVGHQPGHPADGDGRGVGSRRADLVGRPGRRDGDRPGVGEVGGGSKQPDVGRRDNGAVVGGESIQGVGDSAGVADAVVGGADVGPGGAARDRRQPGRVGSTDPDGEDVAAGALQRVGLGGGERQGVVRRRAGGVGDTVGDDEDEVGRPGRCRGQPGAEVARATGGEPADVAVERASRRVVELGGGDALGGAVREVDAATRSLRCRSAHRPAR